MQVRGSGNMPQVLVIKGAERAWWSAATMSP